MFSDVIGHEAIVERLKNAIRAGRIANAYIFSGPVSVGKEFVAMNFAKAINCSSSGEDSCDECISCRRIDDGNHADVRVIRPEGNWLKIDQMRLLQRQSSYRAMEADYKVYVITECEKMTTAAANSLLKTLEEPPGAMVLILVTSVYSALLPTIRSRCQSLRFSLAPQALLRDELMRRFEFPEPKAKWMAIRSEGSPGRALKLGKEDRDDAEYHESAKSFLSLCRRNGEPLLHIFRRAEGLAKAQDSLDGLLSWYRDLLLVKLGSSQDLLVHNDKREDLEKIAKSHTDAEIERLIIAALKTRNLIQRNVNPSLALEVMMLHSFDALSTRL